MDKGRQTRATHAARRAKSKRAHQAKAVSAAIRHIKRDSQADREAEWLRRYGAAGMLAMFGRRP